MPLKTLATATPELSPTIIEHDGLKRTISVLAYYRKGGPPSMDLAMQIITNASATLNFPPGYSLEMRGDMTQMMDSFARLLRGLELALLLIFLVLVAQFGGVLAPLQMALKHPPGTVGRVLRPLAGAPGVFERQHHGDHRADGHGHHHGHSAH